jgi:hypothetical protein
VLFYATSHGSALVQPIQAKVASMPAEAQPALTSTPRRIALHPSYGSAGLRQALDVYDEVLQWFEHHPEYDELGTLFHELARNVVRPFDANLVILQRPEEFSKMRRILEMRAETWLKEWEEEGRQLGIQEGRQQERVRLLIRQLEDRFGSLPDWARDCVRTGESATQCLSLT